MFVEVGEYRQIPWWRYDDCTVSIAIRPDQNLREFDARVLVGCDVILVGDRDARTHDVIRKIIQHAQSITALTTTNPDDLGHVWVKGQGWRPIQHG